MTVEFTRCALLIATLMQVHAVSAGPPAANKLVRVGWLSRGGPSATDASMDAFRTGMRELGYVEGQTFAIEPRYAQGKSERMGQQAAELEAAGVDAIIAGPYEGAVAAKQSTKHVPIVMTPGLDPSATGVIANPAHPEGHITAITEVTPELTAQRVRILKQIAPSVSHVGILWQSGTLTNATIGQLLTSANEAAKPLGVQVHVFEAAAPSDFDAAFATMAAAHVDGLIVLTSPVFGMQRQQIVGRAALQKWPVIYEWRSYVQSGGLISYGANVTDIYRRAAGLVDKIAQGVKPVDLPVEHPALIEMAVNLKAAKELDLTVPEALIKQAVEVIQ